MIKEKAEKSAIKIKQSIPDNVMCESSQVDINKRRRQQAEENKDIGSGAVIKAPKAKKITRDSALDNYVLVTDGKRVVDRKNTSIDMALDEWKLAHRPSFRTEGESRKRIYVTSEWEHDNSRITVNKKTFRAGAGEFISDPEGVLSINTWKSFNRTHEVDEDLLNIFTDHMEFLIPDNVTRNRFIDWLSHIEQMPGELPQTAWLHIATKTGMGRNWLMSVLVRIWAGYVAANFNLVGTLNSGFNGGLSRKILAGVDEIREGGKGQWAHAERLKSLLNEEFRHINPKYGRTSLEFNACRWLIFSNHLSALPLTSTDRRIEVVVNENSPEPESYYLRLYGALKNKNFIPAVASYLCDRDIAAFNPGAHAIWTPDKLQAAETSKSHIQQMTELIVERWPEDLINTQALLDILNYESDDFTVKVMSMAVRRSLEEYGIKRHETRFAAPDKKQYIFIIRNHKKWADAELIKNVSRIVFGGEKAGNTATPKVTFEFLFNQTGHET